MLKSIRLFLAILILLTSCKSNPYATFTPIQRLSFSDNSVLRSIKPLDSLSKTRALEQFKKPQNDIVQLEECTNRKLEFLASGQDQNPSFNKIRLPKTDTKFFVKSIQKTTTDKPKVNTLAVVSSGLIAATIIATMLGVISIIGGLPILILAFGSLIMGIVALSKIKKKQESGKGLAITSIVLSGLYILFLGLVIAAISSLH